MRSLVKPHVVKLGVATLCALASVSAAHAQDASSDQKVSVEQKAVETRQSLLKIMDWSFSPVADMLRNKMKYDAAVVQKTAERVEALAPMIPDAFAVDTHSATGLKTRAREGIWTNMADFKSKADGLAKAAAGLSVAAKGGDEKAMRQAAFAVGKACSACHDNYKDK